MACDHCRNSKVRFCAYCGEDKQGLVALLNPLQKRDHFEGYFAESVVIGEMLAAVFVRTHNRKDISVSFSGDEQIIQDAKVEMLGSRLKISAPIPFLSGGVSQNVQFGGNNISISIGSGMTIVNNQVYVNGRMVDMSRAIRVLIEVPVGTKIKITGLIGGAMLQDTKGDLDAALSGFSKVVAGGIANLEAEISGSGSVTVRHVDGEVLARVSGSGYIDIEDGNCSTFDAQISGSGRVEFGGVTRSARLGVSGSGYISVKESLTPPKKRVSGSGRINVKRAPEGDDD